jgi:hypothetical protein
MYVTSVINVAVEAGFYEVRDAEGEPTDAVERALAGLEGTAGAALTTIEQTQQLPPNGSVERETLATFLAVQFTRTPDHRELILFPERVAKYAADRAIDADLMTEYLQKVHLGFKPQDGEVRGALDFTHVALQDRASLTKDTAIRLTFGECPQAPARDPRPALEPRGRPEATADHIGRPDGPLAQAE